MTQISMQWDGTTTGDATLAPYGQDEVAVWKQAVLAYDRTAQGVLRRDDSVVIDGTTYDLSNLLEATNPSSYTLRVASGGALVDGVPFFSSTNEDFTTTDDGTAITNPGSGSNYYRVVLRKDWSAQTIRLAVLDVNTSAPAAVTQTQGTTWEISLATVEITSGGSVTITDARVWCGPYVSTNNIVNDAVDDTKVGDRVPQMYRRQGGSATSWRTSGTTTYTPGAVRMQAGSLQITVPAGNVSSAATTITFPVAFSQVPMVFVTVDTAPQSTSTEVATVAAFLTSVSTVQVVVTRHDPATTTGAENVTVNWLAIGTE